LARAHLKADETFAPEKLSSRSCEWTAGFDGREIQLEWPLCWRELTRPEGLPVCQKLRRKSRPCSLSQLLVYFDRSVRR
jgi:hypothetical protein